MNKLKKAIAMLSMAAMVCTTCLPVNAAEVKSHEVQVLETESIAAEATESAVTETVEAAETSEADTETLEETKATEETETAKETETTEAAKETETTEVTKETQTTEETEETETTVTRKTKVTESMAEDEEVSETEEASEEDHNLAAASSMKIYAIYLDGNPGDAVLLESGGEYILMDLGDSTAGKSKGSYASVKKLLDKLGVKKLSLYYSHFHGDHTGGVGTDSAMDWLTSEYNVTTIYAPDASLFLGKVNFSDTYEKIERISAKNNAKTKINYLKVGNTFKVGGMSFEIIGPVGVDKYTDPGAKENDTGADSDSPYDDFVNNCSLVARVTCGNTVYLTAGDAKTEAENALINKYKNTGKLDADIYKLSHHGIAPANSENMLACVTPICSFGMNGGYTGNEEYGDNGKTRRMTYSSKQNASAYGLCYMVEDEKDTLIVDVNNGAVKMYRSKSPKEQLSGIVKTVGSYGISYDNQNTTFDFYDYYYLGSDSKPLTGLLDVDFDGDGKTEKHLFGSGGLMYAGTWGYDDNNNFVYKPWLQTGNDWQYYDQKTAVMATGWKTIDGEKYYFDPDTGYRKTGICTIDGNNYMFRDGGTLYVNRWVKLGNDKRYVDENGIILTGFQKLDGGLYYLDPNNQGIAMTGGTDWPIREIAGKYYAVKDTGLIFTDGWKKYGSGKKLKYRYFAKDGVMQTGWFTDKDGSKYYLETSGDSIGYRATGITKVDSTVYNFGNSGKMIKNSWYNKSKSGKDADSWMYFGKNGKRVSGFQTIGKDRFYFDKKTGCRVTGLQKIGSKYYDFTPGGKMQKNTTVKIDGYTCKFNKKGVWTNVPKPGTIKIGKVSAKGKNATVTWTKKSGVTGYDVYMSTSKNGKYKKVKTISNSRTKSYTQKKLKSKKTYYFKVRSYVKVGGYTFYSGDSKVKSVKIK